MNSSIKNDFDILYIKKYQVFSNGIVNSLIDTDKNLLENINNFNFKIL